MLLIYLSGSFIAGVLLGHLFNIPLPVAAVSLLPLVLFCVPGFKSKQVMTACLILIVFCGGMIRYQAWVHNGSVSTITYYLDKTFTFRGTVVAEPEISAKTVHLTIGSIEITDVDTPEKVSGKLLVFAPLYTNLEYGDLLEITGKPVNPGQIENFDYGAYLADQGILATMVYPDINLVARDQGSKFLSFIYSLRRNLADTLDRILPEPQGALAQGFVLGMRGDIPDELTGAFSETGTIHLLAISGLNLTILAGLLVALGLFLFGRRHYYYIWLAMTVIWFYAFLTGLNSPIVRAAVMATLFLLAELTGRQKSAVVALLFAAAVMTALQPSVLNQASFQLSFLAMAGLIFISPPLKVAGIRLVDMIGWKWVPLSFIKTIVESLAVTLAAIIAVWPVIGYYFGLISVISPITTLFAAPALTGIMISGLAAAFLGLFFFPLGVATGWLAWCFLSYFMIVVEGFSALPVTSVNVDPGFTTLAVYYPVLGIILWSSSKKPDVFQKIIRFFAFRLTKLADFVTPRSSFVIPLLILLAVIPWSLTAILPDEKLHVSFLDVGQGDTILISRGSQQILIDGGPDARQLQLELAAKMLFWDRTLDLVIMTHPDSDHSAGLLGVLQNYQVGSVIYPQIASQSYISDIWEQSLSENDIASEIAREGQKIQFGSDVDIDVIYSDSEQGIVLRLVMNDVSFLFTADIGWSEEFQLIQSHAVKSSTVLKVAHHGSNESTTSEFLNVVNPELAIISVGTDNKYGHPGIETMNRLNEKLPASNIYRTDKSGTIELITDGTKIRIRTEK